MTSFTRINDAQTRRGILHTRRGDIATPFFMPDATRASVRGVTNEQLQATGTRALVVNTYHLMLQPTAEFLQQYGGIHAFMHWQEPILTDSGGYQVYSLIHKNAHNGYINEDGARFRSVRDGSWHFLTPERAIEIQFAIGSDMMVVLDDPRPPEASREIHEQAVARTCRWAQRCKDTFEKICTQQKLSPKQRPLLFAVVQGGPYGDLRKTCAQKLREIGFDGYGFGGRHVDAEGNFMEEIITTTAHALPEDQPRFALGIGTPYDIVSCHRAGWDMFDCVIPTREGRHGRVFVFSGNHLDDDFYDVYNITNERYKNDATPLSPTCACATCAHYSRAYIRHLFHAREPLGGQLVAIHNVHFYVQLMQKL